MTLILVHWLWFKQRPAPPTEKNLPLYIKIIYVCLTYWVDTKWGGGAGGGGRIVTLNLTSVPPLSYATHRLYFISKSTNICVTELTMNLDAVTDGRTFWLLHPLFRGIKRNTKIKLYLISFQQITLQLKTTKVLLTWKFICNL